MTDLWQRIRQRKLVPVLGFLVTQLMGRDFAQLRLLVVPQVEKDVAGSHTADKDRNRVEPCPSPFVPSRCAAAVR